MIHQMSLEAHDHMMMSVTNVLGNNDSIKFTSYGMIMRCGFKGPIGGSLSRGLFRPQSWTTLIERGPCLDFHQFGDNGRKYLSPATSSHGWLRIYVKINAKLT